MLDEENDTLRSAPAAPERGGAGAVSAYRRYLCKLAVNTISGFLSRGIEGVAGLVVSMIIARYLLPEQTGIFFYILATAGIFTPVVDLGLAQICVREAMHLKSHLSLLFGNMHIMRGLLFVATMPFVVVLAALLDLAPTERVSFLLCALTLLAVDQILQGPARAALLACEKLHWELLVTGTGLVSKVLALLVVIHFDWRLPGCFAGLLVGAIVRAALAMILVRCYCIRIEWRPDKKLLKMLFFASLPLGLNLCMLAFRLPINVALLKWMVDPEAVAFFNLPIKIISMSLLVSSAVLTAAYPGLCRAATRDRSELRRGISTLLTLLFFCCSAISIVLYFPATQIVTLLFGDAFSPAGPMLALLAVAPVLKTMDLLFGMTFIATGRTNTYLIIAAVATLTNTVLALILIPVMSYRGAVLASITCDVVTVVLSTVILSPILGGSPLSGAIVRPGISLLVGLACAAPVLDHPWVACCLALCGFAVAAIVSMRRFDWSLQTLQIFRAVDVLETKSG